MKEIDGIAIGQRIREHRKKLGLSQTQFGDMIGKNLRTIQKYEKGQIDLSFATVNEIARVLGIPSTELIGYPTNEMQINSFADILSFFFALEKIEGINFSIDIKRPPHHDGWQCSLVFNGKDRNAEYSQAMCLFLEEWRDHRNELADRLARAKEIGELQAKEGGQQGFKERMEASAKATYSDWQDKSLVYYSGEMGEQDS